MKSSPIIAGLLLASAAAAVEPPKIRSEIVGGTGFVKVEHTPFGKLAETSVPNLQPFDSKPLGKRSVPYLRPKKMGLSPAFEFVFFASTRPVRIRVVALHDGKTVESKWEETLKILFAAFDRDHDGRLNRCEADLVFSKDELQAMFNGRPGYRALSGGVVPTLELLDRDGDGSVSFDEIAGFYDGVTPALGRSTDAGRPLIQERGPDQLTTQLFARLDTDRDQQLSEDEFKNAEALLLALDADEDDCVSTFEITSNPVAIKAPAPPPGDKLEDGPIDGAPESLSAHGALPESAVPTLLKRYCRKGASDLGRAEIGFSQATFDKLDTDRNGRLDAKELEAWRTGPADFSVQLNSVPHAELCTAKRLPNPGDLHGIDILQTTPDRIVVRIGAQTIDIGVRPSTGSVALEFVQALEVFPAGKAFIREKDLIGPQAQLLRVIFEPADWNGDGKLTRTELKRYFQLQSLVSQQPFDLVHRVRVPDLFSLIDLNDDGKLGVKELRNAYARLIPMVPGGGKQITRTVLQRSVVLRSGHGNDGAGDPNSFADNDGNDVALAEPKPIWFHKMDRNGDGDISRNEFVGPKVSFDALDANHDGLVTLEEAEAYDRRTRKVK